MNEIEKMKEMSIYISEIQKKEQAPSVNNRELIDEKAFRKECEKKIREIKNFIYRIKPSGAINKKDLWETTYLQIKKKISTVENNLYSMGYKLDANTVKRKIERYNKEVLDLLDELKDKFNKKALFNNIPK